MSVSRGVSILHPSSLSTVGQTDQDKALAAALCDSLWSAGQEVGATVTLVSQDYCITPHLDYKLDNFTEKVPATVESVVPDWSNCPGQTSQDVFPEVPCRFNNCE